MRLAKVQEARSSFLKKRTKRLLCPRCGSDRAGGAGVKVFWFFSPEKNLLSSPVT
jgi:hypothetical protein